MDFLSSDPMPVADHFLASISPGDRRHVLRPVVAAAEVCEKCFAWCADKQALWRHVRDAHGDDPRLACPAAGCGRRFSSLSASAAHWSHHAVTRAADRVTYTCELCGRLSANRLAFDKHVAREHPDARAALCGVCGVYAVDVRSLTEHVHAEHGARIWSEVVACNTAGRGPERTRRTIRCDVCGKRYGNNRMMRSHRQVHYAAVESCSDPAGLSQQPPPPQEPPVQR